MKRLSVLLLGALALFVNACEKHPASQLPAEHTYEFGKHLSGHGEAEHGAAHGAKPATEHAPAAPHQETAKPGAETKPAEAPKFFPEKK